MALRAVRIAVVSALVTVSLGACGAAGPPRSSGRIDPYRAAADGIGEDVLLTIQNNDFRDASIYALWNGVRRRVGEVTGMTSQTFRMEWRSEEIQLAVDFIGGGRWVSERVPVTQGDHLDFVILAGN